MKKHRDAIVILSLIPIAFVLSLISIKLHEMYQLHEYNSREEYQSYTTDDGQYTVSIKYISEPGLAGAIRSGVYLVDNESGDVEYIGRKTLDYYDDFTPYISFAEGSDKVTVTFHNRNFTDELEIDLDKE